MGYIVLESNEFSNNTAEYIGGAVFTYKMGDCFTKFDKFSLNSASCGNNIAEFPK